MIVSAILTPTMNTLNVSFLFIQEIAIFFRDSTGTYKALIGSSLRQKYVDLSFSGNC